MSITSIDLNADLGEGYGAWRMGDDAAMLQVVTSANIACGGHAGDPETMFETLTLTREGGVTAGAHPSFHDREGFGRRMIPHGAGEIERLVAAQVGTLMGVAALAGTRVRYVKPHGALSNLASANPDASDAIARAIGAVSPDLALLAVSGTELERAGHRRGLEVYSEIFADRGYRPDGQLVPRGRTGAMIEDAQQAADRLAEFMRTGLMPTVDGPAIALKAHSICVHGDSPGAVQMARRIRQTLSDAGLAVEPFLGRG